MNLRQKFTPAMFLVGLVLVAAGWFTPLSGCTVNCPSGGCTTPISCPAHNELASFAIALGASLVVLAGFVLTFGGPRWNPLFRRTWGRRPPQVQNHIDEEIRRKLRTLGGAVMLGLAYVSWNASLYPACSGRCEHFMLADLAVGFAAVGVFAILAGFYRQRGHQGSGSPNAAAHAPQS